MASIYALPKIGGRDPLKALRAEVKKNPQAAEDLIETLLDEEVFTSRDQAQSFVSQIGGTTGSDRLTPEMAEWLREYNKVRQNVDDVEAKRAGAFERQRALQRAELLADRTKARIVVEEEKLGNVRSFIARARDDYMNVHCGQQGRGVGEPELMAVTSIVVNGPEAVKFLTDFVIPELRKELASYDAEITALTSPKK